MSRPLRIEASGLTYHIVSRGNGRMAVCLDDRDCAEFLDLLAAIAEHKQLECHAYCAMTNHYHVVATTLSPNLSTAVKHLNGEYARWWNRRHGHVGHVFQGRFWAQIVQNDSYLLTVCRYVVMNPVRSGAVEDPGQWPWSSYRATAGLSPVPRFLKPQTLWQLLGADDRATLRYREYVSAGRRSDRLPRRSVLGDDQFVRRFKIWRESASIEVPANERRTAPSLDEIFTGAITRSARNDGIRLAHRFGYHNTEIARHLGLQQGTVSRVIARPP